MNPMLHEYPAVFQALVDVLLQPFTPISFSSLNSPDAWIRVYCDQLQKVVIPTGIFPAGDLDHLSSQLYPRCSLYVLAYAKTRGSFRVVEEFKEKIVLWGRKEALIQFFEFQVILDLTRTVLRVCGHPEEMHTFDMILRFDILFIAAKVLVWLSEKEQRHKLWAAKGEKAQALLDLFQSLLDCHPEGSSKALLLDATFRLSKESGRVPSSLCLRNLKMDENHVPLGGGSYGDIWGGWIGNNRVAIKSMRNFNARSLENAIKSFAREAVLWRQLRHPNILPFYGVYLWPREPSPMVCLVSPLMKNGNVLDHLQRPDCKDRLGLLLDVARGLEYMHNFKPPTVHGDLKGNNILITPSGRACIADFGLCTFTKDHGYQMTNRDSSGGTGAFLHCAPELLSFGSTDANNAESGIIADPYKSKASDVYAFGCLCFEIFTLRPRFFHIPTYLAISVISRDRPVPQPTNIESSVWTLILSCWERNASSRPTMTEIVGTLTNYIGGKYDRNPQDECIFKWDEQMIGQLNSPWAAINPPFGLGQNYHNNMSSVSTLLSDEDICAIGRNDIIIALMGPSGVGKSSFINTVLGHQVAVVGRSMESCTQGVRAYGCLHPDGSGRKVIIVDTPGFDDSDRTDYEVLRDIVTWLAETYRSDIVLTGILQLHSIAEARMRGTPRKNLEVFRKLCGEHALRNVIMATTFWDKVPPHIAEMRESQLRTDFWGGMIEQGCRLDRFYPPTMETAWRLVSAFDNNLRRSALAVQTEMVDQKKKLHQTSAFGALFDWWSKKLKGLRRRFASNKQPSEKELARAEDEMRKMTRNNSTRSSGIGDIGRRR